ncbi:MAG: hypothetical protein IPP66_17465 [Anaerolineales bacterium]|nr:hypothetical protein [Anaerolineales bacterium]
MGRKGVSKRKPKKTTPHSNVGVSNFNDVKNNSGRSPVQSLMNDKSTPLNKGGANTADTGSGKNKKNKKH